MVETLDFVFLFDVSCIEEFEKDLTLVVLRRALSKNLRDHNHLLTGQELVPNQMIDVNEGVTVELGHGAPVFLSDFTLVIIEMRNERLSDERAELPGDLLRLLSTWII